MSAKEEAEFDRELVRQIAANWLGEDAVTDLDEDLDLDGMIERVAAKAFASEEAEASARARKPTKKELALIEARQAAETALREAYRKLASALHPDRETDPERQRQKTALMQQANAAYEARDLKALLKLQMECAQLDADALGEVPEERIKRFNHALREQADRLEAQKRDLIEAASQLLECDAFILEAVANPNVDALFDDRLEELRHETTRLRGHVAQLADPARRKAALDALLDEYLSQWDGMGWTNFRTYWKIGTI